MGLHGHGKIFHFAGSGHRRISRAVGRQPAIPRSLEYLYICIGHYEDTFLTKIMNCCTV